MRAIPAVLLVLCAVAGTGVSRGVRAEGEDPAASAESLIQRGIQLRRQRNDAGALALFRQANAADPTPRALAQIALAEQALGKWVEAERDLNAALAKKDDAWIRNNVPLLQQALESIQQHLASLSVTSNIAKAELWIDAVRIGSMPAPATRVVAGSAVIEVRAPGYESVRRPIVVPPGTNWREEINLVPIASEPVVAVQAKQTPAAPEQAAEPPTSSDGATQRALALVVGGLGVAALATGGTFAVLAADAKNDYAQHCGANIGAPNGFCDDEGIRGHQDATSRAALATWFLAGGGLAAVAGATLYLTAPRRGPAARIGIDRAKFVVTFQF